MSSPPVPELDDLLHRPFSFYPPIVGIVHNEFLLQQGTWSEMLVQNTKSNEQIWIPRRFFGEISKIDEPVMIVGLNRELEYKSGAVWPHERKVLDMPRQAKPVGPQPVQTPIKDPTGMGRITGVGSQGTDSRIGRMIVFALMVVTALTVVFWGVTKLTPEAKPTFTAKDQTYLELSNNDDYYSVIRKLGQPSEDSWRPGEGELQYQRLTYKDRGYSAILMGTDRKSVRYVGTMNLEWHPLHYVEIGRGANTASMMRGLGRF